MIVAYDENTKGIAMDLEKMGFTVVSSKNTGRYDSYIYKRHTTEGLLNMIDHNENIFLLNVSGLSAEEVAHILQSHSNTPYIDTPSYF
jgi:hypothetical protein